MNVCINTLVRGSCVKLLEITFDKKDLNVT